MTKQSNTERRADAYYTSKEELVRALRILAGRIHAPSREKWKMPEQIVAQDITDMRQAYRAVMDIADKLGIDLYEPKV